MTGTSNDIRERWKSELQRTSDCIPIERLGEDLTPREHSHLAHCARCQAELALWREVGAEDESQSEAAATSAIAAEVRKRLATPPENVVAMPRRARARWLAPALAAAVVTAVVGGAFFMTNREPSIESPATAVGRYRSAAIEVVAPVGDVPAPPSSLRWKSVGDAAQYDVDVMEVDRAVLWHGSAGAAGVELPRDVVAQFVPGKTVLWQVKARHGQAIVADSGIQRFRVSTTH